MHTSFGLGVTHFRQKTAVSEPAFYAGLFAKYGWTKGFVYHGGANASKFYTDSAGTVPCAANADPIGFFGDISGLNNNATQATTGNKLSFNIDANGVRWWNTASARLVWGTPAVPPVIGTSDFTMIAVLRGFGNANGALVMSNSAGGGWGTGGYVWIRDDQPGGNIISVVCDGSSTVEGGLYANTNHSSNTPCIIVMERSGGVVTQTSYMMDKTLVQQLTKSDNGFNPTNGIILGQQGAYWALTDVGASMVFPGILQSADRTAVLNDLSTSFGAWSPT